MRGRDIMLKKLMILLIAFVSLNVSAAEKKNTLTTVKEKVQKNFASCAQNFACGVAAAYCMKNCLTTKKWMDENSGEYSTALRADEVCPANADLASRVLRLDGERQYITLVLSLSALGALGSGAIPVVSAIRNKSVVRDFASAACGAGSYVLFDFIKSKMSK